MLGRLVFLIDIAARLAGLLDVAVPTEGRSNPHQYSYAVPG